MHKLPMVLCEPVDRNSDAYFDLLAGALKNNHESYRLQYRQR